MAESGFVTVNAVIQDLLITLSLGILIIALILAIVLMVRLLTLITTLRRASNNLEEASVLVLSSTKEVSKTLGFFGIINRVMERLRERFNKGAE